MSEWLKETGCKPVGSAYVGSNPTPTTLQSDVELLEQALGDGESLVWTGRSSDRLLMRSDYFFVLLGACLGVMAIGAFIASLLALIDGDGAAAFVGLFVSLLAGAVALFLVFGRLVRRYRRTHGRTYAITNLRVIESHLSETRSVDLASGPAADVTHHFERRGTITVGDIKIENVDNAAVVYELLSAELAKLRST